MGVVRVTHFNLGNLIISLEQMKENFKSGAEYMHETTPKGMFSGSRDLFKCSLSPTQTEIVTM